MMTVSPSARVFLYKGACDLRRSFDRLASMVKEELDENPLSGDWYVFLGSNRKKMKVLYWDRDGYVLWYKRLEKGQFTPSANEPGGMIDRTAWVHLLEGISAQIIKRQPRYSQTAKA